MLRVDGLRQSFVPPPLLSKALPPALGLGLGLVPWGVPGANAVYDLSTYAPLSTDDLSSYDISTYDATLVGLVEIVLLMGIVVTVLASYEIARTVKSGKFLDEPIGLPGHGAKVPSTAVVDRVFNQRTIPLSKVWLAGAALPTWDELVDGCVFIAEAELQNGCVSREPFPEF